MLCFTVRLRLGTYDAAMVDDPLLPEWPPHPARLFCALVAGDPSPAEWDALRWLEALPPPEVHASQALGHQSAEQFLVTNRTEAAGGSQSYPGRRQTVRVKPRLLPASRRFHVVWPAAEPSAEHRANFAALAGRVPYIGRVTSDA
ncbi:MAG: type I-U CRISPR-associated protein Csb2, partial [Aquihabitans sp.]